MGEVCRGGDEGKGGGGGGGDGGRMVIEILRKEKGGWEDKGEGGLTV